MTTVEQGTEFWTILRDAISKVAMGQATRIDHDFGQSAISVYKVGGIIRCDLKDGKSGKKGKAT